MSEPPIGNVPGLIHVASRRLAGTDVDQHSYHLNADADSETVRLLLACTTDLRELTFFDATHPQLSDPGAYVHLVRSPDGLLAQCGNHGWSSSWIPIEQAEAERYLRLCIRFHIPPDAEQITFTEPSNWRTRRSVSRWRWASFRRYLKKRLKSAA